MDHLLKLKSVTICWSDSLASDSRGGCMWGKCSEHVWMWDVGIWFSSKHSGVRLTVGLNDLGALFQLNDSVILCKYCTVVLLFYKAYIDLLFPFFFLFVIFYFHLHCFIKYVSSEFFILFDDALAF